MVNKQNERDGHVERTAAGNDQQSPLKMPRLLIGWPAPDEAVASPIADQPRKQNPRTARAARIALLNDLCRVAMGILGVLVQTQGISTLPPAVQFAIRERVQTFNDFSADNNPYGERDFGNFEHEGHRVYWKIDYYDRDLEFGSEDPTDPAQTTRVLTIMLAEEY